MKVKVVLLVGSILILALFTHFACGGGQQSGTPEKITLRSETATLSKEEVMQVVKDKGLHCPGDNIKGTLKHSYEQAELQGVPVIIDHTTGLMWQQAEDETRFDWREAEAYVAKVNEENLAGFSDWRIPTVEELMSLMESSKKNDNYIDPKFQKELLSTWTIDVVTDAFAGAWFVDFNEGKPGDGNRAAGMGQLRLVRTYTAME